MKTFYRRLPRFEYVRPGTVDEALAFLATHKGEAKVLAGGTDLVPRMRVREAAPPAYVVDLKGITGLDGIGYDDSKGLTLGPLATIEAVSRSEVVVGRFSALAEAARSMASPQVRSRGTIAGNICNAIPSADSAPALLALGASVTITGPGGERRVPIDEFFAGPRETVIGQDEMLLAITIPNQAPASRGTYLKLSPRHSMDLAVVGVAAVGLMEEGTCVDVKIGLGAVAPTPIRAPMAEALLKGQKVTPALIDEAARSALTQCSPIDDHRASREYRCDMVHVMTRRALTRIFGA